MTVASIVKMDSRGRLTLKDRIERNGIVAGIYWALTFGANQTLILTPVGPVQTLSKEN